MNEPDLLEIQGFDLEGIARAAADSDRLRRMYETVLTNTPDFVYIFSLDHKVLYANESLLNMWGRTAEDAIGHTLLEIGYEPWHAEMHHREIDQVRATKQPIRGEVPFNGTYGRREYDYIFVPVLGADGEVEAVAGTTRDVTERRQAEDQLRRNHDIFFALIQNNPFGVFAVDADFRLRQVSLGAQKVFENVRPLEGRDFAEVLRTVWPEPFASEAIGRFRYTLETGEPYASPSTVEQRADIGVVESYDWRIERISLPDGRYGVVCYFYDLSERQRWEAILRSSEERQRLATEAAQLGIWTWQPDEDVVVWENDRPYEIFALPSSDTPITAARFKSEFLHPEDIEIFETAFITTLREKAPLLCECRILRTDGKVRWIEFTGRVVDGEETVRLIGTVQDITDRKEAEESIRLSAEKQSFAVRLADALRPLSDPIEVQAEASRLLGEHLRANRVVYYEIHDGDYVIERDYTAGVEPLAGRYPVASFGPSLLTSLLAGRTVIEADATTERDRAPDEQAAFAAIQVKGHVDVPLVKDGQFLAGMTVHFSQQRDWTRQEVDIIEETAERTWAAVERVRAEAALRESEARAAFVRRSSGVGFWYCDLPFDVLQWDDLVKAHFHLPPDALVTIDTFYERMHPEDRESTRKAIERSIGGHDPYDTAFRTVDSATGTITWVRAIGRTFYAPDGTPTRFDGVTLDVSQQKRAEESLGLERDKLRLMADSMPQKIFTATPDGARNYFNRQWMEYSGWAHESLEGNGWIDLVHPADRNGLLEAWIKSVDSAEPLYHEYRLRSRDGTYRWHLSRAFPKRDDRGAIILWIGSSTDIDDARKAEELHRDRLEREVRSRTEELLSSNEQLQGFTYSVAHDLRQQIRGISTNASLLLEEADDKLNSESKTILSSLIRNAKRLSAVVDDLLAYARLGRQEPKRVQLNLSEMAAEVEEYLRQSGECLPKVTIKIAPGLMTDGDPAMIRLVLENLLDNACKYSASVDNPVIEIGFEGDYFFVRDNGIGFDMEFVGKLFQPFERLHRDSEYSGTGIGLANVRRIVEKHGGKVRAEGMKGIGATFYFHLGLENGVKNASVYGHGSLI